MLEFRTDFSARLLLCYSNIRGCPKFQFWLVLLILFWCHCNIETWFKIRTTRQTGGLHLAYKARVSSWDLSPSLSHSFKPIAACHLQALKEPFVLLATLKRVFVFLFSNFVHRNIEGFLLTDIFCNRSFIQADCAYIISLRPEMAIPDLFSGSHAYQISSGCSCLLSIP